ncbi:MarR family transcriptional regulator [Planotetraspora kaengkrachanensis]|uniref:Transcriptional regulator n=1 Tax=Planotetraspora kaengkrachanensis TaxID=575193 RepID=A0A8J3Q1K4_9ACTN|nr:transcriptional regulator [Planotetraspora kaengkrachanensis]
MKIAAEREGAGVTRRHDAEGGRDEDAIHDYVEQMAMIFARFGFPRMAARVLFALTTSDDAAMTAGELAERLEVSPAAVSGSVRYLMQLNMLIREPVRGSRRDRYRLPDHAWYEVTASNGRIYEEIAKLALTGVDALGGPGTPAGSRVVEMADFLRFLQGEMAAILKRWRVTRLEEPEDAAPS